MGSKAIGLLTMVFGADMKGFNNAMTKAEKSLKKFSRKMKKAGTSMTRNLTMPILAIGGAAAKLSMDFDASMTKITTLVGIADSEVQKMKESVLDLAMATGKSPVELAEGLYFLTSAGLRGANALETLEAVSKASASHLGDMESLSRTAAAAQNAYGKETLTAAEALDIFGGMVQTGMFKAEELSAVLGPQLGIAASLGVSFEEVGAFISTYTKTTGDAASATTSFGGIMMAFAKITPKQEKALDKIGMSTEQLRDKLSKQGLQKTLLELQARFESAGIDMSEFFSKAQALKGVYGVLGEQTQTYVNILDDLRTAQGFVDKAFDRTAQGPGFQMQQAFNSLKVAGTELGDTLAPVIKMIAQKILQLSEWFRSLNTRQKESIVKWAGIIAVVGPLLILFGAMANAIVTLIGVMKMLTAVAYANPYVLLAAAFVAIAAALAAWAFEGQRVLTMEEKMANVEKKANAMTKDKEAMVRNLVSMLKNENISLKQKEKIVAKLKQISPKYYGGLNAAKLDVNALTESTRKYVDALKAEAKIKAATALVTEREMELEEIDSYIKRFEANGNHVTKAMVKDAKDRRKRIVDEINTYQKVVDDAFADMKASGDELDLGAGDGSYQDFLDELEAMEEKAEANKTAFQKLKDALSEAQEELRTLIIEGAEADVIADKVLEIEEAQKAVNKTQDEYNKLLGDTKDEGVTYYEELENAVSDADKKLKEAIASGVDYKQALKDYENAVYNLKTAQDEYNDALDKTKLKTNSFIDLLQKVLPDFKLFGKSMGEIWNEWGEGLTMTINLALDAMEAFNNKATILANNEKKTKEKALDDRLRKEQEVINHSSMTEEQRQRALAVLDGQIADERVKIEEEAQEKLNKIKRRQAIIDKAIAISNIVMSTAQAVMKVWGQAGLFGGPVAAAIVGAIGAAQIALVASTPIPLAEGGIISGPTQALMGEYPSAGSGNPEVVAPLNKLKSMLGLGSGNSNITVTGRLRGNDIFLSNANAAANRLRTA
jgi:TP901 family phage tail tape measure protein